MKQAAISTVSGLFLVVNIMHMAAVLCYNPRSEREVFLDEENSVCCSSGILANI